MKKPKVFVTRLIAEKALELIKSECQMEINPEDRALTKQEIINGVQGKDGLLCLLTDTIDAEIMDASPKLKIIANMAVGFNNIDVKAATERKIAVTNTPGVLTETTADLAWALIMATARRIAEADKFTREGKFNGWGPMMMLGADVHGKILGIIGFGRIGKAVAKRALGFDMHIIYYDTQEVNAEIIPGRKALYLPLSLVISHADFISIHVPLTKETHHFIGEKEFRLMKETAYLINTSRGPIVDEKALVKTLKEKKIAGAGLDVYEEEPKIHPELLKLDNAILLPHIGSASVETRTKMAIMAAENLLASLKGQTPPNIINP